jgi:hypothetical protein
MRPPATEREATVGRALAVDDHVASVVERRPVVQTGLGPELVAQRLGGDHERVDGNEFPGMTGERSGERLGGPHHHVGAHGAGGRADGVRQDLEGRGVFVDGRSACFDDSPQAACQAGRVNGRAVRGERAAQHLRGTAPCPSLVAVEQTVVVVGEPVALQMCDEVASALELHLAACQREVPTLMEVALDALGCDHAPHLRDGVVHGLLQPHRRVARRRSGDRVETHREQGAAPTAVASAGAEADHVGFEQHDAQ